MTSRKGDRTPVKNGSLTCGTRQEHHQHPNWRTQKARRSGHVLIVHVAYTIPHKVMKAEPPRGQLASWALTLRAASLSSSPHLVRHIEEGDVVLLLQQVSNGLPLLARGVDARGVVRTAMQQNDGAIRSALEQDGGMVAARLHEGQASRPQRQQEACKHADKWPRRLEMEGNRAPAGRQ